MLKLIIHLLGLLSLLVHYSGGGRYGCCFDKQWKKIQLDAGVYRLHAEERKWPGGIIFYDVDPHLDMFVKHYIARTINYINNLQTCVRWVERRADGIHDHVKTWLTVYQVTEERWRQDKLQAAATIGWSKDTFRDLVIETNYVLRTLFGFDENGEIQVRPDGEGHLRSILLHELMHVIGFYHEQQRPDRDCFVYVKKELLTAVGYPLFAYSDNPYVKGPREHYTPDFPYDYESVLHYEQVEGFFPHDRSKKLFRKDGKLSEIDVQKIKYMYCDGPTWCEYKENCNDPYTDLTEFYRTNARCYRQGQEYTYSSGLNCTPCML